MPLSPPVEREHIHTRTVTCTGHRRADGLWDIEGHITDVKTYGFDSDWRGRVEPGTPVHDMWIRLTMTDDLQIVAVEAVTDASPFRICPDITPNFQRLVGLKIRPGFTGQVRDRLGGTEGCTHLVELLQPVATTAFQTIFPYLNRKKREAEKGGDGRPAAPMPEGRRPPLLDTCHAFASDGPVVAQYWPDYAKPKAPAGGAGD